MVSIRPPSAGYSTGGITSAGASRPPSWAVRATRPAGFSYLQVLPGFGTVPSTR